METNLPQFGCRHVTETPSARPGREHFIATLALEPTHRPGVFHTPWNADHAMEANPARIGCRKLIDAEIDPETIAPLETNSNRVAGASPDQGNLQAPPTPPWPTHRRWITS